MGQRPKLWAHTSNLREVEKMVGLWLHRESTSIGAWYVLLLRLLHYFSGTKSWVLGAEEVCQAIFHGVCVQHTGLETSSVGEVIMLQTSGV